MANHPDRLHAMILSAAMAALALVLPMAFHAVGMGNRFLPMLLPLLLNGFLVPLPWAVLTGALVPLISSLATGMPPLYPPVALSMALEGAVLGGVAAAIYRRRRSRLWWALPAAIVLGRLTALVSTWVLARAFGLPAGVASAAMLIKGIPGVLLQLTVVPMAVASISRRRGVFNPHES
jgi:hypothetical protein